MTILGVKVNTLRGHYGHIGGRKWPQPGAEVAMREAKALRMKAKALRMKAEALRMKAEALRMGGRRSVDGGAKL